MNVDQHKFCGKTALHCAANSGHDHIVQYLIGRGADINAQTEGGATPLGLLATDSSHKSVVHTLLDQGAAVNTPTLTDRTPLHAAAYYGFIEIVRLLLQYCAKVNMYNFECNTH